MVAGQVPEEALPLAGEARRCGGPRRTLQLRQDCPRAGAVTPGHRAGRIHAHQTHFTAFLVFVATNHVPYCTKSLLSTENGLRLIII